MKSVLIIFSLAVLSFFAEPAVYAQETATTETTSPASTVTDVKVTTSDSRISVDLNIQDDEELSTSEKFELARKAIKENISEELATELQNEIDGLTDKEKQQLGSLLDNGITVNMGGDGIPQNAVLIAVVSVVMIFGMPVFIVLLVLWFGHKKRRQRLELINRFLDAGKDVPPEILNTIDNNAGDSLKRGIMLTGIGIGIVAGLNAVGADGAAGFGLIPMFIGIARILYWFIAERKQTL